MHRILLLYKYYLNFYAKQILIGFGASIGLIAVFHTFAHIANFPGWTKAFDDDYHRSVFLTAFIGGCLIWCGQAFPGFRSKQKAVSYLMIPCTSFEKYIVELSNRIVIYLIGFPLMYWITTNFVTTIAHIYNPDYADYGFSYDIFFPAWSTREITLAASLGFLLFTIPFAGATYFQKLPLLKTVLAVFILICLYFGFGYFVVEILGLNQYNPSNGTVLFIKNEEHAKLAGIWAAIIVNITLLAIAYFRLKEKEV